MILFIFFGNLFLLSIFKGNDISCIFRSVSGQLFTALASFLCCFYEAIKNVVSTLWYLPPLLPSPWIFSFPCLYCPCLAQFQLHPQQFILRVGLSPESHFVFAFHEITGPTLLQYFRSPEVSVLIHILDSAEPLPVEAAILRLVHCVFQWWFWSSFHRALRGPLSSFCINADISQIL